MRVHIKSSNDMNQFKYIIFGSLLLSACAQAPARLTDVHPAEAPESWFRPSKSMPNAQCPMLNAQGASCRSERQGDTRMRPAAEREHEPRSEKGEA